MPNTKVEPTIPNYPPQGIQAQLDLLYLWNPDVANDLIEQLNKALEEVGADLSAYLTKAEAADTYATQQEVTTLSGAVEEVSNKVDTLDNDLKELGDQTTSIQQDVNSLKTGKQDTLNTSQLSAINSGITSAKVTAYDAYAGEISAAQSTADKADGAAEVAQQTANLAGQEAAQALSGLAGKVNVNQGTDNSGKVMVVGADGNLAPASIVTDLGNQVTEIQSSVNTLNTTVEEMAATVSSNVFTENLGNDIVRISGTESFGVLAQQATTEHPITLPVTLTDTNFVVQTTATSAGGMCEIVSGFSARTTTGFTIEVRNLATAAEATDVAVCWTVTGQKA